MLYEVELWTAGNFGEPDITCTVMAASIERAAVLALREHGWPWAAYVSVSLLHPVFSGIVASMWGPVYDTPGESEVG